MHVLPLPILNIWTDCFFKVDFSCKERSCNIMSALAISFVMITIESHIANLVELCYFICLFLMDCQNHLLNSILESIVVGDQESRFKLPKLLLNFLLRILIIWFHWHCLWLCLTFICVCLEQTSSEKVIPVWVNSSSNRVFNHLPFPSLQNLHHLHDFLSLVFWKLVGFIKNSFLSNTDDDRRKISSKYISHILLHINHVFSIELMPFLHLLLDHFINSESSGSRYHCGTVIILCVFRYNSLVCSDIITFLGIDREWKIFKIHKTFPIMFASGSI